jgi:hypothetical protein
MLTRLRQLFCSHRFDLRDLWPRNETGNVRWPCWKCDKVFKAECGLDILSRHGQVEIRKVSVNMNEQQEARLHEIMAIARKLSWFYQNQKGYPLMQGSEVEKCILMAMDDFELERFRVAADDEEVVKINREENPLHA